ncbi:MAG TPA: serine protease, partial [Allocoleopsis sp.]
MKNLLKHWATIGLLALGMTACGVENRELTPKQIAEGNKPGTVWIEAIHKAEIAVPDYTIDQDKLQQLKQALINQARRGNITSKEQAIAALLQEMLANPLQYLQPTDEIIRKSAEVTSTGTGSLITEDGYVVTNAHVVSSEGEDLKRELAKNALKDVAIASCRDIMGDLSGDQTEAAIRQVIGTQEFKQLCLEGMARYFAHYMKLSQPETKVYTAIGAVAPNEDLSKQGYLSEIKAMGKPTPGKDVAILKINQQNLPTVILGDDKSLETGDRIYILGYPAAAITNNSTDNEASLTAGLVSARKTMPDDWEVLQTDAAMSSGNSGGPVFNDQG